MGSKFTVSQALMFDSHLLNHLALFDNGWAHSKVGVDGCHVAQTLVNLLIVVVRDERRNLGLDLAWVSE